MKSSKENSRSHAARILSIMLESVAEFEFVKFIKEMIEDVNHKVSRYVLIILFTM